MTDDSDTNSAQALRDTLDELTLDIGRILHANTSTLLMVNQTLISTIETLWTTPDPADQLHEGDVGAEVPAQAAQLARAVERLIQAGSEPHAAQALDAQDWAFLSNQVELLDQFQTIIPVEEMHHPALRKSAHRIAQLCRQIEPGHLPKEPIRETLRSAEQLQRSACVIDALTTRTAVIQMDASLRALRDFITADLRTPEDQDRLELEQLVRETVAQLAEFARASHVEVKVHNEAGGLTVVGEHRELSRALANLLHNAIKYSWRRDRGSDPWVAVRLGREGRKAYAEFETWGVPITHEEIEEGTVFQIGYRGKFSTDRGRLGTGIGLTDALRVAKQHGGSLTIDSHPARPTSMKPDHPEFYRQPFLTCTRLSLPDATL
jgi:signal transduction histidine kinase